MAEEGFLITPEFIKEMSAAVKEFQGHGVKAASAKMKGLQKKYKIPASLAKGQNCAGCISCGACPIVHIKAGYLLAAFFV